MHIFKSHTCSVPLTFQVRLRLNNTQPYTVNILHLISFTRQQSQVIMFIKIQLVLVSCWKPWVICHGKNSLCLGRPFEVWMKTQEFPISFQHLTEINLASLFWGSKNSLQFSWCSHETKRKKKDYNWRAHPLFRCWELLWPEHLSHCQFRVTFLEFGTRDSPSLHKPKSTILSHIPLGPAGKLNFSQVMLIHIRNETEY